MRRILVFVCVLVFVSACAPDPRKEAQAFAIRTTAEQDALNQSMQRDQAQELHGIRVQELQVEAGHKAATAQEWRNGLNTLIRYGSITFTIGLCAFLLVFSASLSKTTWQMSEVTVRAAMVKANLIYLDGKTRQFPLFVQHVHGSRYALHNPNAGSVLMLDEKNEADRQLIATSGVTQLAGVIGQEARQSSDPTGISVMQPPVVTVSDGDIVIGGSR